MRTTNKVHLQVRKDEYNEWFNHSNKPSTDFPIGYKLQLKGDTRLWPTFIEKCAEGAGVPNFMEDFEKVLKFAEENKLSIFTLYVQK